MAGPSGYKRRFQQDSDDEDEEDDDKPLIVEEVPVTQGRKGIGRKSSGEGKGSVKTPAQKKLMNEVSIQKGKFSQVKITIIYIFLNFS